MADKPIEVRISELQQHMQPVIDSIERDSFII